MFFENIEKAKTGSISMVEWVVWDHPVAGSSPVFPTIRWLNPDRGTAHI